MPGRSRPAGSDWRPRDRSLAKRARLSRSADFQRVYREGRSVGNRYLVLHAFPRAGGEDGAQAARLGLSVSRRVGGAVVRNRVKRLLREAFPLEASGLVGAQDVVVVARPEARALGEREGLEGVRGALRELIDRLVAARSAGGGSS